MLPSIQETIAYCHKKFHELKPDAEQRIEEAKQASVYHAYGRGGEIIHRGFLCPSPVEDLVITNVNRGRLIQKPRVQPSFVYGFNRDGMLCWVSSSVQTEAVYWDGAVQYSIGMSSGKVRTYSECRFLNDRITQYLLYDEHVEGVTFLLHLEKYAYDEHGIREALYQEHFQHKDAYFVSPDKICRFVHDEDGRVVRFIQKWKRLNKQSETGFVWMESEIPIIPSKQRQDGPFCSVAFHQWGNKHV